MLMNSLLVPKKPLRAEERGSHLPQLDPVKLQLPAENETEWEDSNSNTN